MTARLPPGNEIRWESCTELCGREIGCGSPSRQNLLCARPGRGEAEGRLGARQSLRPPGPVSGRDRTALPHSTPLSPTPPPSHAR